MEYEVLLPFSYKFNEARRVAIVGGIIKEDEIDPLILKYALSRKKIKPVSKKEVESSIKMQKVPLGQKKIQRSSEKEPIVEEPIVEEPIVEEPIVEEPIVEEQDILEEVVEEEFKTPSEDKLEEKIKTELVEESESEEEIIPSLISFDEEGLIKKSKSELKRVCIQLGLAGSGTKKMLMKRILKSGL